MAVMKGGFIGNEPIKALYKGKELIWQKQEEGGIPSYYELATDDDFEKGNNRFTYIGNKEYIILPEKIQGETFELRYMFYNNKTIKGVAGKASDGGNAESAFNGTTSTTLELIHLDTSNINNMMSMFENSKATVITGLTSFDTSNVRDTRHMFQDSEVEVLDLSSFDMSKVRETYYMFWSAKATVGYARTQEDADKLNDSGGKPWYLNFVVKG